MDILTILVRHGPKKYATAEQDLADLFRRQLRSVRRRTVVVDTALREHDVAPDRGVIGGDNSSSEFSGFDSGVAFLGDDLMNYDLVNFTTSAFRQLYVGYLERFTPQVLSKVAGQAVCLGHIDCYNEPVEVEGCHSQHWIRTACMFLRPTDVRLLGSLVSARGRDRWFSGNPEAPFRLDAPLSNTYKRLITNWLTGEDIGQGVQWHTRIALNERNLPEFERKALAILNEHLLGIRLRVAGCRTIDVTWLSGQLARGRPDIDWNTPWWRQLTERDRDVVVVPRTGVP